MPAAMRPWSGISITSFAGWRRSVGAELPKLRDAGSLYVAALRSAALGHAQHLQRAGAVGQAADELAFLQRGDQAVDARTWT